MNASGQITPWQTNLPALAQAVAKLNRMTDAINAITPLHGGDGIDVHQGQNGTAISVAASLYPLHAVIVQVTATQTGDALYDGHSFIPDASAAVATNFTMPSGMVDNGDADVVVCNMGETAGHCIPLNTYVVGFGIGLTTETTPRRLILVSYTLSPVFPVEVTTDGGYAGSSTTTISATYTAKDISGTTTLGTGLSPLMNRALMSPANVTIAIATAGSIGTACYDGSGNLKLLWVQETPSWGC